MTQLAHAWLSIWLWASTAIAIAVAIHIVRSWKEWNWLTRLVAIFSIWIVPHVWEEWVFPGGFHYMYNTLSNSTVPDRYPMSELTDMWTNFGILVVGVAVFLKWGARTSIAIAAMLFCALEVFAHTISIKFSLDAFGKLGQTAWYDPGLITTVIGFLPLLIGFIICFVRNKPHPTFRQWLAGVAMLLVLVGLIFGPEALLKDPQNSYPYPNNGYYDQFVPA